MELNKLKPVIVAMIYFVTITKANLIILQGKCPFDDLKASPEAYVSNFGGKINVLDETFQEESDKTDITTVFNVLDSNVIKDTNKYRSTKSGECEQFNVFLTATETVGVYDTKYEVAPDTEDYVPHYVTYFLYFDKGQLGVSFMCRDLPERKYEAELKILSGSTRELSDEIRNKVQSVLDSNQLSYLQQYLVKTKFIIHVIQPRPVTFIRISSIQYIDKKHFYRMFNNKLYKGTSLLILLRHRICTPYDHAIIQNKRN